MTAMFVLNPTFPVLVMEMQVLVAVLKHNDRQQQYIFQMDNNANSYYNRS